MSEYPLSVSSPLVINANCSMQSKIPDPITKTCPYNFDPLKPHFYIVKLGFTVVYIIFFLFLQKNIDCWYPLESPRRCGSNEYQKSVFWAEIWKKYQNFLSENFQFLVMIFSIYLYKRVFVMRQRGVFGLSRSLLIISICTSYMPREVANVLTWLLVFCCPIKNVGHCSYTAKVQMRHTISQNLNGSNFWGDICPNWFLSPFENGSTLKQKTKKKKKKKNKQKNKTKNITHLNIFLLE